MNWVSVRTGTRTCPQGRGGVSSVVPLYGKPCSPLISAPLSSTVSFGSPCASPCRRISNPAELETEVRTPAMLWRTAERASGRWKSCWTVAFM
eukprot:COSAG05_NODE_2764_length_2670_cov_3.347779_4_plen_93_part_00